MTPWLLRVSFIATLAHYFWRPSVDTAVVAIVLGILVFAYAALEAKADSEAITKVLDAVRACTTHLEGQYQLVEAGLADERRVRHATLSALSEKLEEVASKVDSLSISKAFGG